MRVPAVCTAMVAYLAIGHPPPALAQVDQRAADYFKEAQALPSLTPAWAAASADS